MFGHRCYFVLISTKLYISLDYVALIPMLLVVKSLIVEFPYTLSDTLFFSG